MKKLFKILTIFVITFVSASKIVLAADYNYTITSKDVTVGSSVTLTIDGTGSKLTGRFNITSSNTSVATLSTGSIWIESNKGSVTISAKKAGTTNITIMPTDGMSDANANAVSLNPKVITITVKDKPVVTTTPKTNNNNNSNVIQAKPKSSNNFLSSLSVEGLKLDNEFDKEKLEYKVETPAETTKVVINGQLADSSAKVSGLGEKEVKVGDNVFKIVVTAENGNTKTYQLTVTVPELIPTIVKVDNREYEVVKSKKDLPEISEFYEATTVTIGEDTVPGYSNKKLNYEVVALKDAAGNIDYYIYKDNSYTLYKEYRFNNIVLEVLDKELSPGYVKTNFSYGNGTITSYQEAKVDIVKNTYALDSENVVGNQFYLFYARNVETGEEQIYQYDAKEKTIQRYNMELLEMYKENKNTYYLYILVLLGLLVFFVIITSVLLVKNRSLKKSIKKSKKKEKE